MCCTGNIVLKIIFGICIVFFFFFFKRESLSCAAYFPVVIALILRKL